MNDLHPNTHDYLPAAGHDGLLPFYDVMAKVTGARRVYRRLLRIAAMDKGETVLEIGCGTGSLMAAALRRQPGIHLTGIDPDPLALDRARRKAPVATFKRAYAQDLPFADATFDRVLSSLMIHHLEDEAKGSALVEARRVIKPGGTIHVADITAHRHGQGLSLQRMTDARIADDLPGLLGGAGFVDVQRVDVQKTLFGTVEFFNATRNS